MEEQDALFMVASIRENVLRNDWCSRAEKHAGRHTAELDLVEIVIVGTYLFLDFAGSSILSTSMILIWACSISIHGKE